MALGAMETVIDQLADELGRSVVINDPAMQMLYASPHYGDEDPVRVAALLNHGAEPRVRGYVLGQGVSSWTRPGVIPADTQLQMHARVCFPVRWHGELLGLVMVMDADRSITTAEMGRVEQTVAELALALHSSGARAEDRAGEEHVVLDLVSDDPTVRRSAAAVLARRAERFPTVVAVEIAVAGRPSTTRPHVEIALRHAVSAPRGPERDDTLFAVTGSSAVLVLAASTESGESLSVEQLEARVTDVLDRTHDLAGGHFRCVAGIGSRGEGFEHASHSLAQARLAGRAAQLGLRGPVASWEALGGYGPVLSIPPERLTRDALPPAVQRLRVVDPDGQLAATVRAYLDAAGNGPTAAARLHIHRTSLYYRLGRIHDLTGLDLNDGATRLACHLGFVMLDVLEAQESI